METVGKKRYGQARRTLITADSGGRHGNRNRLWKCEPRQLADETGMAIEVRHYAPGTSKWNKIEHRLFCHITRNWRGVPLESHQVGVNLVGAMRTSDGLDVHCRLNQTSYAKGRKISDIQMSELNIKRNAFHGDWNYEVRLRR